MNQVTTDGHRTAPWLDGAVRAGWVIGLGIIKIPCNRTIKGALLAICTFLILSM